MPSKLTRASSEEATYARGLVVLKLDQYGEDCISILEQVHTVIILWLHSKKGVL